MISTQAAMPDFRLGSFSTDRHNQRRVGFAPESRTQSGRPNSTLSAMYGRRGQFQRTISDRSFDDFTGCRHRVAMAVPRRSGNPSPPIVELSGGAVDLHGHPLAKPNPSIEARLRNGDNDRDVGDNGLSDFLGKARTGRFQLAKPIDDDEVRSLGYRRRKLPAGPSDLS